MTLPKFKKSGCEKKTCYDYCVTCANHHEPEGKHYVRTCTGTLTLKKTLKCDKV